jgi:ABC-type antimicrobial peptide transport system permease subunit
MRAYIERQPTRHRAQQIVRHSLGALVGLVGAMAATRGLKALLYGVTSLDPATYAGVVVSIVIICAVALLAPARRAANIDPAIAPRSD